MIMKYFGRGVVLAAVVSALLFPACVKDPSKPDDPTTVDPIVPQSWVDLSYPISANCYIVSSAGEYMFQTVQGNSTASVGNVASADVLWESFGTSRPVSKGDIISSVSYSDGYITFSTPEELKDGNAVIAAKDMRGNILWSWHIWVCGGYDPMETAHHYYYGNLGAHYGYVMDRNLGATSAEIGSVGALGLKYQWGRKDPFLSSTGVFNNNLASSTLTWPAPVASDYSNGTVVYSVNHPTTIISPNSYNDDWFYFGRSETDNTRWQSEKTIYDPCPPGWQVPRGGNSGLWKMACRYPDFYYFDLDNRGGNFGRVFAPDSDIWYPAAGAWFYEDGTMALGRTGNEGGWWSCTPDGNKAYCFIVTKMDTGVGPVSRWPRVYALSVRCCIEE